jgi:ankyrin repeat protein
MQALLQKQQQDQAIRNILSETSNDQSVDQRVQRCRSLQYEQHQSLFAIMYTTIHKAAIDNSILGVRHFLQHTTNTSKAKARKRGIERAEVTTEESRSLGAVVNALDEKGYSALHYAAEKQSLDAMRELLEHRCDVDLPSCSGDTALMLASKHNQLKALEMLITLGHADLLRRNHCGMNAAHYAAQGDSSLVVLVIFDLLGFDYQSLADQTDMAVLSMTLSSKKFPLESIDELEGPISGSQDLAEDVQGLEAQGNNNNSNSSKDDNNTGKGRALCNAETLSYFQRQ